MNSGLRSIYGLVISTEGISFAGSYPAAELMPVEPFRRAIEVALAGPVDSGHAPLADQFDDLQLRKERL